MTFPGFTCGNLRKGTKSRKLKILRFGDCKGEVKRRGRERGAVYIGAAVFGAAELRGGPWRGEEGLNQRL